MISDELLAEQKIRFLPSTLSPEAHSKVRKNYHISFIYRCH